MTVLIFCPHCREIHTFEFHRMTSPLYNEGSMYTHYGICINASQMVYGNPEQEEYIAFTMREGVKNVQVNV